MTTTSEVSLADDDATDTSAFKRGLQKFAMHSPSSHNTDNVSHSQAATSVQSKSFEHDVAYSDDEDGDTAMMNSEMKAARAAWKSRKAAAGSVAGKSSVKYVLFIAMECSI